MRRLDSACAVLIGGVVLCILLGGMACLLASRQPSLCVCEPCGCCQACNSSDRGLGAPALSLPALVFAALVCMTVVSCHALVCFAVILGIRAWKGPPLINIALPSPVRPAG